MHSMHVVLLNMHDVCRSPLSQWRDARTHAGRNLNVGRTSYMVHVQVAHAVCFHDGFWQAVVGVQKPGVVIHHKLPIVLVRP